MDFLKNMIRDGIRKGVSEALGNAVKQAVEPTATRLANEAAETIDRAASQTQEAVRQSQETVRQTSGWEGALGNLQRSMEGYATQAAQNMKICPRCEATATADQAFCPHCGTKLPEMTVAQGAVCTACGKQNTPGTKFCSGCGAKLPAAVAEEQAQAQRDAALMAQWEEKLAQYPKWNCGGSDYSIEEYEPGVFGFSACFNGDCSAAARSVDQYLQLARQHGFRPAGEYPSERTIYNKIGGVCYCIDTTDCLAGDGDCPTISLWVHEPVGGFDYVKPEPKKKVSFFDLFK